ncbi:unnamed protein product [Clavelina lepadiformis]|uniref:Cystatin domain-containing protein n=1 Tax=Clavelina lepadiformis TaxID=159417 RepID=A0ABP0F566_CLALP
MEQAPQTHPGGLGGEKPATSDIQQLCDMVKADVEMKIGKNDEFVAVTYRSQVVAGTMFFIKVILSDIVLDVSYLYSI